MSFVQLKEALLQRQSHPDKTTVRKRYELHHERRMQRSDLERGNQYIAHAMPLDVMSAGPSPEGARKALDEAVRLFLVTATDMGTSEEILQESGYESTKSPRNYQEQLENSGHSSG